MRNFYGDSGSAMTLIVETVCQDLFSGPQTISKPATEHIILLRFNTALDFSILCLSLRGSSLQLELEGVREKLQNQLGCLWGEIMAKLVSAEEWVSIPFFLFNQQ